MPKELALSDEQIKEITNLYLRKISSIEIAKLTGISVWIVRSRIRKLGIYEPGRPQGFQTMNKERHRELMRENGRMSMIGKIGGAIIGARRDHMSAIGKIGGNKVAENRAHMASIARKQGKKGK